jgi:hypothetical protein
MASTPAEHLTFRPTQVEVHSATVQGKSYDVELPRCRETNGNPCKGYHYRGVCAHIISVMLKLVLEHPHGITVDRVTPKMLTEDVLPRLAAMMAEDEPDDLDKPQSDALDALDALIDQAKGLLDRLPDNALDALAAKLDSLTTK